MILGQYFADKFDSVIYIKDGGIKVLGNTAEDRESEEAYLKNKREKGETKQQSDFMNFCDINEYKIKKFFPYLSPIEMSAKLWDQFNSKIEEDKQSKRI